MLVKHLPRNGESFGFLLLWNMLKAPDVQINCDGLKFKVSDFEFCFIANFHVLGLF
jgi:hypothetical protein